jgi:hypothetical protein
MSFDEIDLDRVVVDPDYRRLVIEFLNASARQVGSDRAGEAALAPVKSPKGRAV